MKKLLAAVLSLCLALSLCAIPAMAATADFTGLIEEVLTTEVSTAITTNFALPETWKGAAITWESSNPNVIEVSGNTAIVKRGVDNAAVTLTAIDATDAKNTKVLNYTVLSLLKKVWYNENFYAAGNSGELGVAIPALNSAEEHSLKFVESAEGVSGKAGFYTTNGTTSVVKNPLDDNDYALRGVSSNSTLSYFTFAFPDGKVPTGKVYVTWTIASTGYNNYADDSTTTGNETRNKHRYIKFYTSGNNTIMAAQYWLNAGGNKLTLKGSAQSDVVTGLPFVSGTDTYACTYTTEFDFNAQTQFVPNTASCGTYKSATSTSGFDIEGSDLKKIAFDARRDSNTNSVPLDFYVDDVVITTDTAELPGDTDAEKIAVYKRLLTNAISGVISDENHVTNSFNLNLLTNFPAYTVTWESSDESAIAIDAVNKKADVKLIENIKDVTLTGTISYNGVTDTITLPLTVKPYNSSVKSPLGDANTTVYGKLTYEDATIGTYGDKAYNTMHRLVGSGTFDIIQETATNKCIKATAAGFRYGSGSSTGAISGAQRTVAADVKIVMPEGAETIEPSFSVIAGGQGPTGTVAQIYLRYTKSNSGNVTKELWVYTPGKVNVKLAVDEDIIPDPGEWFNLQFVTNNVSQTFDVYIDGQRVSEKAFAYPEWNKPHPTSGEMKVLPNFYTINFTTTFTGLDTAELYVDNVELLVHDASTNNIWADLALASIDSVSDTLVTTGVNGTALTWTATGDATINEAALAKTKSFGYGEATVTASATVEGKGTFSRVHNLYYGTKISEANVVDGRLQSIKYVSETPAKGYIVYYSALNGLLRITSFDVKAGKNTIVSGAAVPESYSYHKIFVWNENLSPLNVVFP